MKRRKRTKAELRGKKEKLHNLVREGMSVADAATELDMSINTCYKWLENTGIELKGYYSKAKELSSEIIRLNQEGLGYRAIAKQLGVARSTIRNYCRNNGIPNNEYKGVREEASINEKTCQKGFTYISGYENMKSKITVKCNRCGSVSEKGYVLFQRKRKVPCVCCIKKERQIEREQKRDKEEIERIKKQQKAKEEREARSKLIRVNRLVNILKRFKECPECGKLTLKPKYCSKSCARKSRNRKKYIARRVVEKNASIGHDISLRKLYVRDKGICYLCGKPTNYADCKWDKEGNVIVGGEYPSVDHVMPLAKGGKDSWENIKLAHCLCNSKKGAKVISSGK